VAIVQFADYRRHDAAMVEAGNALMALLAGAQLAAHLLKLNEGSQRLLPEVYPNVQHIGRFNLRSEAARELLESADTHLGAMGVPYALAIHEDYNKTCLSLLESDGKVPLGTADRLVLARQHGEIESATGGSFAADSLLQLDTLRLMRNCLIHEGGRAGNALVDAVARWDAKTAAGWTKVVRRTPQALAVGDIVAFGYGEMLLALAVTKSLARQANQMLQTALTTARWADLVVADLFETSPGARKAPDRLRRAKGLARHLCGSLGLTELDLQSALVRA